MAQFSYASPAGRVHEHKGEILGHSIPREVLGITGQHKSIPKNVGDNVSYRRYLPHGGATTNATTINQWSVTVSDHAVSEGVTPNADSLTPQDINVALTQYACLYMYTDKVKDMYEDDIPSEMKKLTGERMGLLREKIRYGALKACTNKFYSGGTTRATVDEALTATILSKAMRSLMANRADPVTRVLPGSGDANTTPIEGGFLFFGHTDLDYDIRALPGFVPAANYGSRKLVHELELGSWQRIRFILSPELDAVADAGAAVGSTGLKSTSASNIDVFFGILTGDEAWGDVMLRGMNSFDMVHLPPGQKDKYDPLGQKGYVGAKFYSAAKVFNDGHMAIIECGATDL